LSHFFLFSHVRSLLSSPNSLHEMFCKSCRGNIFDLDVSYNICNSYSHSGTQVVHENMTTLLCSASMGCELCSLLWSLVYPAFESPYPALPDYQTSLAKFLIEDHNQSHDPRPVWEGAEYPIEVEISSTSKKLCFYVSKKITPSGVFRFQIAELETCVAYVRSSSSINGAFGLGT
jgi:hypothetical protein